jgi:hypothetical protein
MILNKSNWKHYCDEVGDCQLWKLGCNNIGHPIARVDGRVVNVRRFIFSLSADIPPRYSLLAECGEKRCINPAHMRPIPFSELVRINNKKSQAYRRVNSERLRRGAEASGWTRLNMDIAREIREQYENTMASVKVAAEKYGVDVSHIRSILRHQRWKEQGAMPAMVRGLTK